MMRGVSLMVLVFGLVPWAVLAQTSTEYSATARCTVSDCAGHTYTQYTDRVT